MFVFQSGKLPFSDLTNDSSLSDALKKSRDKENHVITKPDLSLDHLEQVMNEQPGYAGKPEPRHIVIISVEK